MKISIIIPIYNAAPYISRTIESVLSQSYHDFELILVDDGSKDNSLEICKSFLQNDKRVRLTTKPNGGVSSARNVGLEEAKGEWICFIDSDDELMPGALEAYHDAMADMVDVIRGGFERIKKSTTTLITTKGFVTADKEKVLCTCNETRYEAYLWNSCFRKEAIRDIQFNERLSFCEDHLFTYTIMSLAQKVAFISDIVYRYYAPETNTKGAAQNLSSRYLEASMILQGATLERDVKLSCLTDINTTGKMIVQEEFEWKVRHALKYAVIGGRYQEAFMIVRSYKECNYANLLNYILHIKIAPAIRKLIPGTK